MTRAKDVEKTEPFYPLLVHIQISTAIRGEKCMVVPKKKKKKQTIN